jgi:hypothetical protein
MNTAIMLKIKRQFWKPHTYRTRKAFKKNITTGRPNSKPRY